MAEDYTEDKTIESDNYDTQNPEQAEDPKKKLANLLERLDSFGASLAKTRTDATSSRMAAGVEQIWLEDEEYYEGVDELNRSETRSNWRQKPVGQGNISTRARKKKNRSTIFPNITAQFVDAAAARIADMVLPTDDRVFSFKITTIPETIELSKMEAAEAAPEEEGGFARIKGLLTSYGAGKDVNAQNQEIEAAKIEVETAKKKAEAAQDQIDDWFIECQWHAEVRTVIENSARIGVGILKGPVPITKKRPKWEDGVDSEGVMTMESVTAPGSKSVDPWNFFPDGGCGDNIHNGGFVWERDYVTKKQLRDLMLEDGYQKEQILKCLKEGPQMAVATTKISPDPVADPDYSSKFEIWYYHGTAEKEDLISGGCDCEEEEDPHLPAMVTMVNSHVIKASLNPLVTGDYPYDVFPWRRVSGHWTGIGVARQVRPGQRIVTGGTRNLMDNAGLAAGPMIVFKKGVTSPADNVAGIGPRKVFYIAESSDLDDARKAIGVVKVDMLVDDLLAIINYGVRVAEDTSGFPMISQGQKGPNSFETVGQTILQNNNMNSVLRRLVRMFDDKITEPHVRRYYKWVLLNTDDDALKGDFLIDARGSSALLERDIQNTEIPMLLEMSGNPMYGIDPKKAMEEYLKSKRFNPANYNYDDEEWQKMVENMSQPPPDSALEIAGIRKEVDEMKEKSKHLLQQNDIEYKNQARSDELEVKLLVESMHQDIDAVLEDMKVQGMDRRSLEAAKTKLTDTIMKLNTQVKLSGTEALTPPVEPRGRAKDGRSFQD